MILQPFCRIAGTGAFPQHAFAWTGTANSAVDLHPAGLDYSQANDIFGTQIVGYGGGMILPHAMLWDGLNASAIDIHANGLEWGITLTERTVPFRQAMAMKTISSRLLPGSVSAIDLNSFIPGATGAHALGIDAARNIVGEGDLVASRTP